MNVESCMNLNNTHIVKEFRLFKLCRQVFKSYLKLHLTDLLSRMNVVHDPKRTLCCLIDVALLLLVMVVVVSSMAPSSR